VGRWDGAAAEGEGGGRAIPRTHRSTYARFPRDEVIASSTSCTFRIRVTNFRCPPSLARGGREEGKSGGALGAEETTRGSAERKRKKGEGKERGKGKKGGRNQVRRTARETGRGAGGQGEGERG